MFFIVNKTRKNITISDIKVSLGPRQAIDLDKNFIVKFNNVTVRALNPPFHPNCRTTLRMRRVQ